MATADPKEEPSIGGRVDPISERRPTARPESRIPRGNTPPCCRVSANESRSIPKSRLESQQQGHLLLRRGRDVAARHRSSRRLCRSAVRRSPPLRHQTTGGTSSARARAISVPHRRPLRHQLHSEVPRNQRAPARISPPRFERSTERRLPERTLTHRGSISRFDRYPIIPRFAEWYSHDADRISPVRRNGAQHTVFPERRVTAGSSGLRPI